LSRTLTLIVARHFVPPTLDTNTRAIGKLRAAAAMRCRPRPRVYRPWARPSSA